MSLSVFEHEGRVRVREWISKDLGDAGPTKADFLLSVPPNTRAIGFGKALPKGGNGRQIDISSITDADLETIVWGNKE